MSRLSHRACRRSRRGPRSAEWFRQTLAVHSQLWKKEMAADWDVSDELLRRIKQLLPWALTSLLSPPLNAVGNEHARAERCGTLPRPSTRGPTGVGGHIGARQDDKLANRGVMAQAMRSTTWDDWYGGTIHDNSTATARRRFTC